MKQSVTVGARLQAVGLASSLCVSLRYTHKLFIFSHSCDWTTTCVHCRLTMHSTCHTTSTNAVPHETACQIHVCCLQAFGMMGWRVGYLAFPEESGVGLELLKAQDTIPICAPQLSQQVALGALEAGRPWVQERLKSVINNRCCSCTPFPSFLLFSFTTSATYNYPLSKYQMPCHLNPIVKASNPSPAGVPTNCIAL